MRLLEHDLFPKSLTSKLFTNEWRHGGSNSRPLQCHCSALPTELIPLSFRALNHALTYQYLSSVFLKLVFSLGLTRLLPFLKKVILT